MAEQPPPGGPPQQPPGDQPPGTPGPQQPAQPPPYQPPAPQQPPPAQPPPYQPPAAQQPPPPASYPTQQPAAPPPAAPPPAAAPVPGATATATATQVPPAAAPPKKKRRLGCFGCGCLTAILLIVVLVIVIFVALPAFAQGTTPAPAEVVVIAKTVQVKHGGGAYQTASTGQALNQGDSVKALPGGMGAIRFPDGSVTDVGPGSEVKINDAKLTSKGDLAQVSLLQVAGRSFSSVKKLVGGAHYNVQANGTTAEVRGTKFEVLMDNKGTWIGVFKDTVHVRSPNGQERDISEKHDVRVGSDGNLQATGNMQSFGFDQSDPFGLLDQSLVDALKAATREGTSDQYYGPGLKQGESAQQGYYSPGGDLSAVLTYPGSQMELSVKDPDGNVHKVTGTHVGGRGVASLLISNGKPGLYSATIKATQTGPNGEPYALSMTANPPCTATDQPEAVNGVIRRVFDPALLERSLAPSGVSLHIDIAGVGNGVLLSGTGSYQGIGGSGAAIMYVNSPYYGIRITDLKVFGLPFSQNLINQNGGIIGAHIDDIDPGFAVDRIYSCKAPNGDVLAVLEGHEPA